MPPDMVESKFPPQGQERDLLSTTLPVQSQVPANLRSHITLPSVPRTRPLPTVGLSNRLSRRPALSTAPAWLVSAPVSTSIARYQCARSMQPSATWYTVPRIFQRPLVLRLLGNIFLPS